MPALCAHPDAWFSRVVCECGDMHYYCVVQTCGAQLGECSDRAGNTAYELSTMAGPLGQPTTAQAGVLADDWFPPVTDGLCFGCEMAPATTTCGSPNHPCQLCLNCRLSLDGLEYDDEPPQAPTEGARYAGAEEPGRSESAPTTQIVPSVGSPSGFGASAR